MSMTQFVIGTALGFFVAQGVLYIGKQLVGVLRQDGLRRQIERVIPLAWIGGFTRYAALVGASAAVITLGVWGVGDYVAAKAARTAAASAFDTAAATGPDAPGPADDAAVAAMASTNTAASAAADDVDPYADKDFKVRRSARTAGSLEEKLLQRSEAKAGNDLVREMRQHTQRSQYDCEAADRARRYLKAGLDVWGFGAWQAKYFPVSAYRGATLDACKDIKHVIDPSDPGLDLHSTVALGNHS